jgi:hypothetical protein
MPDPLKLAEEIESFDGAEFYEADSDDGPVTVCNLAFDVPTIRLVAAALRLAEVLRVKEAEIMADPFAVFDRGPFGTKVLGALAAYRAAKEGR